MFKTNFGYHFGQINPELVELIEIPEDYIGSQGKLVWLIFHGPADLDAIFFAIVFCLVDDFFRDAADM